MTTQNLQEIIGATPDGNFGPKSVEAAKSWVNRVVDVLEEVSDKFPEAMPILKKVPLPSRPTPPPPVVATGDFDDRTKKNLATLNAKTRELATAFLTKARALFPQIAVKIVDGSRTFAEQDELYAQGRTKPGKIVTNAKGGQSNHNFQRAFDVGVFIDGAYQPESKFYGLLGPVGESVGLEWGGRWKSPVDQPHYQSPK